MLNDVSNALSGYSFDAYARTDQMLNRGKQGLIGKTFQCEIAVELVGLWRVDSCNRSDREVGAPCV